MTCTESTARGTRAWMRSCEVRTQGARLERYTASPLLRSTTGGERAKSTLPGGTKGVGRKGWASNSALGEEALALVRQTDKTGEPLGQTAITYSPPAVGIGHATLPCQPPRRRMRAGALQDGVKRNIGTPMACGPTPRQRPTSPRALEIWGKEGPASGPSRMKMLSPNTPALAPLSLVPSPLPSRPPLASSRAPTSSSPAPMRVVDQHSWQRA